MAYHTSYKYIKTLMDEIPFRRDILQPQKYTTTSQIMRTSFVSGASSLNSKLPAQGPLGGPNPEPTVMVSSNLPSPYGIFHHPTYLTIPYQGNTETCLQVAATQNSSNVHLLATLAISLYLTYAAKLPVGPLHSTNPLPIHLRKNLQAVLTSHPHLYPLRNL